MSFTVTTRWPGSPPRQYDVRDTERDKVVIYDSFRPNDVVRCQVISLGDARSYMLSTAAPDLGVVYAESEAGMTALGHRNWSKILNLFRPIYYYIVVWFAGAVLVPLSWCEMQCEQTGMKEKRKVAKVSPAATPAARPAD